MGVFDDYKTGTDAYHKLDTISDPKASLKTVRDKIIIASKVLKVRKENMTEENKNDRETFIKSIADANSLERQKKYDETVNTYQSNLKEALSAVMTEKRAARKKYMLIPPTDEQLRIIQSIQFIGIENIPDEEMPAYLEALCSNHQCSQILARLYKDSGKEFIPPVSIANVDDDLNQIEKIYLDAIDNITDPYNSILTLEFFRDDLPNTRTSLLTEKLDREIVSTRPSGNLSTKNRLRNAANHALHVGNFDLFNHIGNFIKDNISRFETKEEAEADFALACEQLIEAGNNAKEVKATPYEKQRDKVINTLEKITDDKKGAE